MVNRLAGGPGKQPPFYIREGLDTVVAVPMVEKRCHGCGQWRRVSNYGTYCPACYRSSAEGEDLAFHDDNFDKRDE